MCVGMKSKMMGRNEDQGADCLIGLMNGSAFVSRVMQRSRQVAESALRRRSGPA